MFEGNRYCGVCKKELSERERNFGVSLTGYSHVFCRKCTNDRKEAIRELLDGE